MVVVTVLDHKLLSQHRAGRVLALAASALGSSFAVRSERPTMQRREPGAEAHTLGRAGATPAAATSTIRQSTTAPAPVVAVVDIFGPLAQRGESHICGYVDGYDWIGERLSQALEEADAVLLRVDSPGGDAAGCAEAVRRMRAAVEASGKRVIAYVDELAASAAYWIVAGVADEIVVPPMGGVGSIGTWGMLVDATKANEQDGYGITIVRNPAGKAEAHPASPLAELALSRLQSEVAACTSQFVGAVAARRGLSTSVLVALDGAVLHGADAVAAGLADRVGTLEETLRALVAPREQKQMKMKAEDPKPEPTPAAPKTWTEPVPIEDGKVTCPECGASGPVAMPADGAPAPEEKSALAALTKTYGVNSALEALTLIAADRSALAALRADVERRQRADLGAALVRAGVAPSEVWADPLVAADRDKREVSALYAAIPLDKLRELAERKAAQPEAFVRRTAAPEAVSGLSQYEIDLCKAHGITPEKYQETRTAMHRG